MVSKTNPISIDLGKRNEYNISIKLENWNLAQTISESALKDLRDQIDIVTGLTKISEDFDCSGSDAKEIKNFWDKQKNWNLCNNCHFKWKACHDCVVKCDSPLERDLMLELYKNNIDFIMQRRFNKDGSFYEFPKDIDFDTILTIPDFYIEKGKSKLCVYADGHTYHERTEKQALRDRNIDRELQKLGFIVLRYTGQEIRKNCSLVVENILANID